MPVAREFDLNIERVLESWTVAHAIREIIANALDEAALSATQEPEIFRDAQGQWHIRDYGRGLRYEHLTQNESAEKLAQPARVVGRLGVGLKDALATFERRGIGVRIRAQFGEITIAKRPKHGFADITTLHAVIAPAVDPAMTGTDVVLDGASETDVVEAKALFRQYAGDVLLEATPVGVVLARPKRGPARIYVNGMRVAEEKNYLFSYDITAPTKALRAALNRERSNVGRSAYSDRVKAILLAASSAAVAGALAADLSRFASGRWHDETQLLDVGLHACRVLGASGKVVFLTPDELILARDDVEHAEEDGYRVVIVATNIRAKLAGATDVTGAPIVDLDRFREIWGASFVFAFVDPAILTSAERRIFDRTADILALRGGQPSQVREILISSTMRPGAFGSADAAGVWDETDGRIVIKRDQLRALQTYAGDLLHEVAHAVSGTPDVSVDFEDALTTELGQVAAASIDATE